MVMGWRMLCTRWAGQVDFCAKAVLFGGALPFSTRGPRRGWSSMRIFASDGRPERESLFPRKLMEMVKLRLGFKEQIASSPGVDEELEKELVQGFLQDERLVPAVKIGKEDAEGETSMTRHDLFPDVLWEQGEKDLRAEKIQRPTLTSPGFSFSTVGNLFPYHLGVCDCLIENGYLRLKETSPLARSLVGALVCAVVAGGLGMSDALQAAKEVSKDCRERGTAFRVGAVLRGIMEKYLPEDAHTRVNARIRVAVTQIFRQPRGLLFEQFDSREDLINALHTSCFIPGYFAPKPVTIFRNRVCIDGGFTLFMPPTTVEHTSNLCIFCFSI